MVVINIGTHVPDLGIHGWINLKPVLRKLTFY